MVLLLLVTLQELRHFCENCCIILDYFEFHTGKLMLDTNLDIVTSF